MFIFNRTRSGSTEVFEIIIPEESLQQSTSRFGNPIKFNYRDNRYHVVGTVVLINETDQTEYLLAVKAGLTEDENNQLESELELLVGRSVRCYGSGRIQGYFEHDIFKG